MKIKAIHWLLLVNLFFCGTISAQTIIEVDICVYGGSSAGIIAGYTAKKLGKSVIVIEPGRSIGGLTTGGLGATDIGNKYAVTGLAKDYYRRIGAYYNKFEQWTFEPHVATKVYNDLVREVDLNVLLLSQLQSVKKEGNQIKEIVIGDSNLSNKATNKIIRAKMFIDCTYEGDLMAAAGVSYTIGREANKTYGETYNGVQVSDYHQIPDGVDPYKTPGDPESGLLYGISSAKLKDTGSGDGLVQAYNFRLCLTQNQDNLIPFVKPDQYKPENYELLHRILQKENWKTIHSSYKAFKDKDGKLKIANDGGFLIKNMPNGKTDFNNFGGFSTDMIGANYDYPDGDYAVRAKIWKNHEDYTKGLLYYLSTDKRVPENIRKEMSSWGYARDEFKETNGFSNQLYVREARRMVSNLVMNQNHCEGKEVVNDPIAMAAYGMDSHNCQRIVINGMVKNEGDVQERVTGPFPISYRSIVPKVEECKNLLVPVCLSASHIAFGSIRMEPVFMVLGQSAATAAVQAIDENVAVQKIAVDKLIKNLKADPILNGRISEIILDNDENDVKVQGKWSTNKGGYGKNFFMSEPNAGRDNKVIYSTKITEKGKYDLYTYLPITADMSPQINYIITNGAQKTKKTIKKEDLKVIALSAGEWVSLGTFELKANTISKLEVLGDATTGKVIADAIIWKKQEVK